MTFLKTGLLGVALTLFVAACAQNNPVNNVNTANNRTAIVNATPAANQSPSNAGAPNELAVAGETFKTACAKCHKENGEGGEVTINGKKMRTPNFKSERMKNDEDADFIDAITNGIADEGMPSFKDRLNEQQIKDLVKYIRTDIQGK